MADEEASGFAGRELVLDDELAQNSGETADLQLNHAASPVAEAGDEAMFGQSVGPMFESPFDALGKEGQVDASALELESVRPPEPESKATATSAASVATGVARTPVADEGRPALETSVAPDSAPTVRASSEALALADFGDPPVGWWGTPGYALHVAHRRRVLRIAMNELEALRVQASDDLEAALNRLGYALWNADDFEALKPLEAALDDVRTRADAAQERDQELQNARRVSDAQRAALEHKRDAARDRAAPFRKQEAQLRSEEERLDADMRRAQARLNRAEIAERNLANQPDASSADRDAAEAEVRARHTDVEQARACLQELKTKLTQARQALAERNAETTGFDAQLRALDAAEMRSEAAYGSTAGAARARLNETLRSLAEQGLEVGVAEVLAAPETKSAEVARSTLETRDRQLALHREACGAYAKKAFQTGMALLVVAGVSGLCALLTLLFS